MRPKPYAPWFRGLACLFMAMQWPSLCVFGNYRHLVHTVGLQLSVSLLTAPCCTSVSTSLGMFSQSELVVWALVV